VNIILLVYGQKSQPSLPTILNDSREQASP